MVPNKHMPHLAPVSVSDGFPLSGFYSVPICPSQLREEVGGNSKYDAYNCTDHKNSTTATVNKC